MANFGFRGGSYLLMNGASHTRESRIRKESQVLYQSNVLEKGQRSRMHVTVDDSISYVIMLAEFSFVISHV